MQRSLKSFYTLTGMVLAIFFMAGTCLAQVARNSPSGPYNSASSLAPGVPANSVALGENAVRSTPKWKTGIALYSFNKHPFTAALDKVDSAGVKYVEGFSFYMLGKEFGDSTLGALSPDGIARMKKMLQDKGLSMESIYVDTRGIEGWKKYFSLAKTLGAHYLTCEPSKDQWDLADSLAGVYGIRIAIHEHSREQSAYWHPDSVLAAMKGHPNIDACADLGHWARSGLDPVQCLQKLKGHILGIHLKDIDSLNNPNAADVIVGTGVINFPAVVKELKSQGFKGMIYMECEHKMDNNLPDVIQSLKYFNSL